MTKLIIARKSEWANRGRKIGIYLDGKKIGTIESGETREFELQPGEHDLQAKIDWCGSQKYSLNLEEGDTQKIKLSGFPKGKWTLPILAIIQIILLVLNDYIRINQYLMLGYSLALLLYIAYPITFGRHHYLKLTGSCT